jgi:hypothetical protein
MARTADVSTEATSTPAKNLARAIDAMTSFVESFEPERYSGADAAELVSLFARSERVSVAGKTLAATRAAEANCHRSTGHRSPAEWLTAVTGESMGDAFSTLRLGDQLAGQPGVKDAFRSGKLSKVRTVAVAGAVSVNPKAEGELLRSAQGPDTLRQLRDRCLRAKFQARSKADEAARYEALHRSRYCRTWTDAEDGSFRLDARLTPEVGADLVSVLREATDRVFTQARTNELREPTDAY